MAVFSSPSARKRWLGYIWQHIGDLRHLAGSKDVRTAIKKVAAEEVKRDPVVAESIRSSKSVGGSMRTGSQTVQNVIDYEAEGIRRGLEKIAQRAERGRSGLGPPVRVVAELGKGVTNRLADLSKRGVAKAYEKRDSAEFLHAGHEWLKQAMRSGKRVGATTVGSRFQRDLRVLSKRATDNLSTQVSPTGATARQELHTLAGEAASRGLRSTPFSAEGHQEYTKAYRARMADYLPQMITDRSGARHLGPPKIKLNKKAFAEQRKAAQRYAEEVVSEKELDRIQEGVSTASLFAPAGIFPKATPKTFTQKLKQAMITPFVSSTSRARQHLAKAAKHTTFESPGQSAAAIMYHRAKASEVAMRVRSTQAWKDLMGPGGSLDKAIEAAEKAHGMPGKVAALTKASDELKAAKIAKDATAISQAETALNSARTEYNTAREHVRKAMDKARSDYKGKLNAQEKKDVELNESHRRRAKEHISARKYGGDIELMPAILSAGIIGTAGVTGAAAGIEHLRTTREHEKAAAWRQATVKNLERIYKRNHPELSEWEISRMAHSRANQMLAELRAREIEREELNLYRDMVYGETNRNHVDPDTVAALHKQLEAKKKEAKAVKSQVEKAKKVVKKTTLPIMTTARRGKLGKELNKKYNKPSIGDRIRQKISAMR